MRPRRCAVPYMSGDTGASANACATVCVATAFTRRYLMANVREVLERPGAAAADGVDGDDGANVAA